MSLLQPESQKIRKDAPLARHRSSPSQRFKCSKCEKAYKSYPVRYLHMKQNHGQRDNNKKLKAVQSQANDLEAKVGRPKKSRKFIDEMCRTEANLESAQDDLMWFLGEKLSAINDMAPKEELEIIEAKIREVSENFADRWLQDLHEETIEFLSEYNKRDAKMQNLDFEEEFMCMDSSKSLKVIIWFMLWLVKFYVKTEFIPDISLIFSRIWKVLDEKKLAVQDLDNKLLWKMIVKDCEELNSNLTVFKNDLELLGECIERVC